MMGASGWLFKKKSITMHGNVYVKFMLLLNVSHIVSDGWSRTAPCTDYLLLLECGFYIFLYRAL